MTSARPRPELAPGTRWSVVALLALALFINYVDRGVLPNAAHLLQEELGFSTTQLGLLFSAFYWSYALLQIPVGWIAERFGGWRVLACGVFIWACATMLVGVAHSLATLLVLRLMLGVGESAGFPCTSKVLATVVPVSQLGVANGIVSFAYLFGPAVGAYCGGLLMVQYGWRGAFAVFGALSLLWLLPWARMPVPARATRAGAAAAAPWGALLRQPALWGTSLGHFSGNYTFYFMLTWLPFYLVKERGFSTAAMATLTGSAYLVNALSALAAGWATDAFIARTGGTNVAYKGIMALAHIGAVGCMLCIALGSPFWALGAIFVYQILTGLSSPGTFAIAQILAGPAAAGRWVGIQNAIANLSGVLAPALAGLLIEQTQHFTAAFVLAASVSVLGLFGWVWIVPSVAPLTWPTRAGEYPLTPARPVPP